MAKKGDPQQAQPIALRFTLTAPAVDTAIVGTKNPARWRENAELLEAGPMSVAEFETIRDRWREIALPDHGSAR